MIPRLQNFCGCFALPAGVLVAGLGSFLRAALALCHVSSRETLRLLGLSLGPTPQIAVGGVALVGVPLAVLAAFGAMYRIEKHTRLFAQYLVVAALMDAALCLAILLRADMCAAIADEFIVTQGPIFVCIAIRIGAASLMWAYVLLQFHLVHAVWSEAEMLSKGEFPELLHYGGGPHSHSGGAHAGSFGHSGQQLWG